MKIKIYKDRSYVEDEHDWFAWHPVIAYDGSDKVIVWLSTIKRKLTVWYDHKEAFLLCNMLVNILSLGTMTLLFHKMWVYDVLSVYADQQPKGKR